MTPGSVKRFNVIFGSIFLTIGIVALLAASGLFLLLEPGPGVHAPIWAIAAAPTAIGLVFTILGGTFMVIGLRQASKETRLLRDGTTTEATVVAIERTGNRLGNRWLCRIRYVYDDFNGGTHEGTSGLLSEEDALSYRLGEKAFIRYDAARLSSSIWLGREELPT